MNRFSRALAFACALLLAACASMTSPTTRPAGWSAPEVLVAPSSFSGVHGLAVDASGRLLAGSVVGYSMWEVDRRTGAAKVLIGASEGQADDIAIGPKGELAWTNYLTRSIGFDRSADLPERHTLHIPFVLSPQGQGIVRGDA